MSLSIKPILALSKLMWPQVAFYRKQRECIESTALNKETIVVAANKMGKDFVGGFIALTFFMYPQLYFPRAYVEEVERRRKPGEPSWVVHTRRVVTTSVREKHLDVLWGEMGRYLMTCQVPILEKDGGPLIANSKQIRLKEEREASNPINYIIGTVSERGEGLSGHHAAYTLCMVDEASGADDMVYEYARPWAKKFFIFGNANQTRNFFWKGVKGGDLEINRSA